MASDGHGGTETLTLSHTATGLHVSIALVYPGNGPPYWQGSTSGGNVTVNDALDDVSSSGTDTHGQQVANGPADGGNVFGGLEFESVACTYAILAGAGIDTVTTGAGVTQSVGPATFSWNVTPTFLAPVKSMCEVPDLVHEKLKKAKRALRTAGCRLGKVTRRRSSRVAKGLVISTRPPAFTVHRLHTKVALTISAGKKR